MLSPLDRLRCGWTLLRSADVVQHPHHLQVVVTDRCHLACSGCLKADPAHRPGNRDMPLERYVQVLERLRPRLVTLLGEGDPLLHRDLAALVAEAAARGARPYLATNLSVGDEALLADLRNAGLTGMKVTLSCSSRRRYRELKGRDLFDAVLERVVHARRHGLPLVLELWLDKASVHEVEEHVAFAAEQGLRRVEFLWSDPHEERHEPVLDDEQVAALERAERLAEERGVRTDLARLRANHGSASGRRPGRCALPWIRAYVGLDGRTGPCVDLVVKGRTEPELDLANAFEDGAPYAGEPLRALRRAFRRGEEPHAICEGCRRGRVGDLVARLRTRS